MIIIKNNIIPFKGFSAMSFCGLLFVRKGSKITEELLMHEEIHLKQQKEMLFIGFYLWYLTEWIFRVLFTKDRFSHRAYKNICFEQEAYLFDSQSDYMNTRKAFRWVDFL